MYLVWEFLLYSRIMENRGEESTRSASLYELNMFCWLPFLGFKVNSLPKDYVSESERVDSCLMVFHTPWKLSTLAWFGLAQFLFLSFSYTGRNCTSTPCIRVRGTFSVPAPGSCSTCCWTGRPRAPWFPAWARTWTVLNASVKSKLPVHPAISYIHGFHFTLINAIANRLQ